MLKAFTDLPGRALIVLSLVIILKASTFDVGGVNAARERFEERSHVSRRVGRPDVQIGNFPENGSVQSGADELLHNTEELQNRSGTVSHQRHEYLVQVLVVRQRVDRPRKRRATLRTLQCKK